MRWATALFLVAGGGLVAGCDRVLGLNDISVQDGRVGSGSEDAPAPWSLVVSSTAVPGFNCTITSLPLTQPTASGDLVVVGIDSGSQAPSSVSDSAADTYLPASGSPVVDPNDMLSLSLWYSLDVKAGVTQIDVPSGACALVAWDAAGIASYDTSQGVFDPTSTLTPSSPAITTTHTGELVIAAVVANDCITQLASESPFNEDSAAYGDGWAHLMTTNAPAGTYTATWDAGSSAPYCSAAIAFVAANH